MKGVFSVHCVPEDKHIKLSFIQYQGITMSSHFIPFHVQLIHATLGKGVTQRGSDCSTYYINFQNATSFIMPL